MIFSPWLIKADLVRHMLRENGMLPSLQNGQRDRFFLFTEFCGHAFMKEYTPSAEHPCRIRAFFCPIRSGSVDEYLQRKTNLTGSPLSYLLTAGPKQVPSFILGL